LPGFSFCDGENQMKNANGKFFSAKTKLILAVAAIPVLVGGWRAFRPEKLFINQQVSEAAPASVSGEAEPLYTGKLESREHPTGGRATIYRESSRKNYLRLTDFATSNGPDVHVLLVKAEEPALSKIIVPGNLEYVELGSLKGNQGDQNYDLPAGADLEKYQAVAIYCERFHAIFAVARLEKF
jgi:Electron transfer DM13